MINSAYYKTLSSTLVKNLLADCKFAIQPKHHQLVSLIFALDYDKNRVVYFHDIGTGKTLTALWTAELWKAKKTLVVCPISAFTAWERDISKYTKLSWNIITGSLKKKKQLLDEDKDIYVINYEGLKSIFGELADTFVMRDGKLTKKRSWKVYKQKFIYDFDCVIYDEIHKFTNYSSLQTKICRYLTSKSTYSIGLTGTPINNNMINLFSVVGTIDQGQSLGDNFFFFRQDHFYQAGFDWIPKAVGEKTILKKVASVAISYSKEECLDLPDKVYVQRVLDPSPKQLTLEKQIFSDILIKIGNGEVKNEHVLNRAQKLLQVTGGFIYTRDEDGNKIAERIANPKLKEVEECLLEIRGQVLLFHQFIEEALILEEWCKKQKIPFATIRGGTKDKMAEYKRFKNNSKIKIMIAHPISAGESFDFSFLNTIIFYSNGYSFLQRTQAEGRTHRLGQENKCTYIDLVIKNSIDEIVAEKVQNKKDLSEKVLNYIRNKYK